MKALVIGKPVYDFILPLVDYPLDGDKFYIEKSINTLSNFSSVVSIALAKFGVDTSFTGVVGEDVFGQNIKEIFKNNNVDIDCIETSYSERTCINHKIYNQKTNTFTNIEEKSIKQGLLKYKYEFIPNVVIMDNSDYNANMAAINNYSDATFVYLGEKFTKESSVYCNKCNYVIGNLSFASELTGVLKNLNKPKEIVSLFQKYLDIYNSNLIIKLDNFDFLYCINDEVRLIKNVNNNLKNKDYLYYSILIYFLINTKDIENSIKYTNKVMLTCNNDLNILNNIPDFKIIEGYLIEINNLKSNTVNTNVAINNSQVNNVNNINNERNTVVNNQNNNITQNSTVTNNQNNNTTPSGTIANNQNNNVTQNSTVINNKVTISNSENVKEIEPVPVTKLDNLEIPQKGDNNIEKL